MQARREFSNQKIIILIVFMMATLMASVFIFHMRSKTNLPSISADIGLIYPAPREIKPFELITGEKKFTQKNLYGHWTLLFFGFTHCSTICPTTLSTLNIAYEQLALAYPNLQVVLISLDPERDSPARLNQYAQSFNNTFIGAAGKYPELRKLQSQFGIYSGRDPSSGEDYQLNHTATINLINPQGKWAGVFHYDLKPKQLADAVKESIQQLKNASS